MIKCVQCSRVSDLSDWEHSLSGKRKCPRCGHNRYIWWFVELFKNKDTDIKEV